MQNEKIWRSIAGLSGLMAVVMGALAAHAVRDAAASALAEKASFYQLIHSVALLWLSGQHGKRLRMARWVFAAGIILFCGTLYIKSFTAWSGITILAPAGGISFMAGWLLIALAWPE